MNSNFSFIQQSDPGLAGLFKPAREAEEQVYRAPRLSALMSRIALEEAVRWIYDHDADIDLPYQDTLSALMFEQSFRDNLPPSLDDKIHYIRKLGNQAAHQKVTPDSIASLASVRNLYFFLKWLVTLYSEKQPYITAFNEELVPAAEKHDKGVEEIRRIEQQFHNQLSELKRKDRQLREMEEQKARLEEQLTRVSEIKDSNKKSAEEGDYSSGDYTEWQTRQLFIDLLLREAGWDPKGPNVAEYEVTGMPASTNPSGIGYVDYVLWGNDGLPLAVVEAKKTRHDAQKGQRQAELYADSLERMKGRRPVIFYTNGYDYWIWDDVNYAPRRVHGFYTRDELQLMINRRDTRKDLSGMRISDKIAGRYYQEEAIKRVAESLMNKKRQALLVMATGSGKTRTAAAIVDILARGNWVKNVLFLADRNALVTQAKNAFKEHVPYLNGIDLTKEKEDSLTRLVFSTYPTIMNKIDGEKTDDFRFYGPGHFDLIIIDEAHRSVYQKYKAIFDYFDAMLLGLTATPKAEVDKNTYELFGLDDHDPTYAYELDKAVADGYLTPPRALSVPLQFPREGIKYKDLPDEEKEQYELTFRDEETGQMPLFIDSNALLNWLFNEDTVDKILAFLMEHGLKVQGGDKLGKTILFAASHNHAKFIEERFNRMYPEKAGKFLRVIDNYEDKAQSLLDDFSDPKRMPQVAVSVDMLDTGIDIHEILNLVFFKRVRSSAKFWQMIGRGTRLCENIFGPGRDKEYFYIFDFCENFEFFDEHPDGIEPRMQQSLNQQIFSSRLQLTEILREPEHLDDENKQLREKLLDSLHKEIRQLNRDNFQVRMHLRAVDEYRERSRWDNLSKSDLAEIREELLPVVVHDRDDELAKRFDLLMLRFQIALLTHGKAQENYVLNVKQIASGLKKKGNIPAVSRQIPLITELTTDEYWKKVNLVALEKLREALRDLVQFIDKDKRELVYTDFEDTLSGEWQERELVTMSRDLEGYRMRVEKYIREHRDHLAIQKLRKNIPITRQELEQFEDILFDGGDRGTREDLMRELGEEKPLGWFIRSIVGLDVQAAKEAFAGFLQAGNLSADQIRFIDSIIDHLSHNGVINKAMLFERPFTDINDQGLNGVFLDDSERKRLLEIIDSINSNAVA